jgi:hypothetical protein
MLTKSPLIERVYTMEFGGHECKKCGVLFKCHNKLHRVNSDCCPSCNRRNQFSKKEKK